MRGAIWGWFVAERGMDGFADEVQPGAIESARRFHHRQILTAGVLFRSKTELSKDDCFPKSLLRRVIRGRDTFMMHKHEQTEALVAQTPAGFCGLRFIAQRSSR